MAYYCNMERMTYNGKVYQEGQEIPDFGTGNYDDILLNQKQVVSDGKGTGVEAEIANKAQWRKDNMVDADAEAREEQEWQKDFKKYQGDRERVG